MAGNRPTAEQAITIASLASQLCQDWECSAQVTLVLGDVLIEVRSDSAGLIRYLAGYFGPFVTEGGAPDIVVTALEAAEFIPPVQLLEKTPDPGKAKIKEEYADLADGRVVRKRLTGMVFLMSERINLAIGPCMANANQVINFVNSRYLEHLLRRGGLLCHASACASGTRAIVIAGRPGAGKSTLALRLLDHGFDFVSNDRLVLMGKPGSARVKGVPKLPRVNPGTIVGQPRLHRLMAASDLEEAKALTRADLWQTERKLDVPLDVVYGPGRFRLDAHPVALLVLDWHWGGGMCKVETFDPARRPELLSPLVKDPGLFLLDGRASVLDGPRPSSGPSPYAKMLRGLPAHRFEGGVDFDAAVRLCLRYRDQASEEESVMGRELKMKGSMDTERAAGYLDQLADSLRAGIVSLQTGKDSIVLNPGPQVWVEVEAEQGKNKGAFSIEVSWASAGVTQDTDELIISSEPPALVVEEDEA